MKSVIANSEQVAMRPHPALYGDWSTAMVIGSLGSGTEMDIENDLM